MIIVGLPMWPQFYFHRKDERLKKMDITDTPLSTIDKASCVEEKPRALHTLLIGEKGTVKAVTCENRELRNKLLSMGIVEGTHVEVTQVAPFGDPIKIKVLGFALALRIVEAAVIHVFPC